MSAVLVMNGAHPYSISQHEIALHGSCGHTFLSCHTAFSIGVSQLVTCPKTNLCSLDQALTSLRAVLPITLSYEPLSTFPSIGITFAPTDSTIASTQSRKLYSNSFGLIRSNTRRNLSAQGIPSGKNKNVFSH
ncbi:hypothetical protein [Brunnivagina elsteri]|uniref:Uncharacterized protein n=1 Tax=Brunnivagina elsteri CCALA 953 TaxID=987040 RepID=A0A2A2TLG7_9CYAN|nr:hypothetical protein [Calothrix elsteri]PAX58325.1 hypothetical protein CK510_08045 [Calothrix elsteri CCALA 953]